MLILDSDEQGLSQDHLLEHMSEDELSRMVLLVVASYEDKLPVDFELSLDENVSFPVILVDCFTGQKLQQISDMVGRYTVSMTLEREERVFAALPTSIATFPKTSRPPSRTSSKEEPPISAKSTTLKPYPLMKRDSTLRQGQLFDLFSPIDLLYFT